MSHEVFKVGDVVEVLPGKHALGAGIYIGQEGVIEELSVKFMTDGDPKHSVRMKDGVFLDVAQRCLRKRRPPPTREQTSTWDDVIVWRPKEIAMEEMRKAGERVAESLEGRDRG